MSKLVSAHGLLALCLALLLLGNEARQLQGSPIHLPTSLRKLAEEPDGYCDATRRAQDPDCGGAVPAAACARTSGMAAAAGYPGYCMQDAGCMSIQLGQLDAACPGMWSSPPVCFPPCYAILSAIAPACRTELLSWENGLNTVQIQYGQPAYWLWRTLFGMCSLA